MEWNLFNGLRDQTGVAEALVKVNSKLAAHADQLPAWASPPIVQPRTIDDVPVLALTFWSPRYDHFTLRRVAAQLADELRNIKDVSATTLIGGPRRQRRELSKAERSRA